MEEGEGDREIPYSFPFWRVHSRAEGFAAFYPTMSPAHPPDGWFIVTWDLAIEYGVQYTSGETNKQASKQTNNLAGWKNRMVRLFRAKALPTYLPTYPVISPPRVDGTKSIGSVCIHVPTNSYGTMRKCQPKYRLGGGGISVAYFSAEDLGHHHITG